MDSPREKLHEAIADVTPFDTSDDEDVPTAGVVTAWVLVAEWQGDDGNRWLSKLSCNATGDKSLPSWTERGLCNEIANHWSTDGE